MTFLKCLDGSVALADRSEKIKHGLSRSPRTAIDNLLSQRSALFWNSGPIEHAEIMGKVKQGRQIQNVILEAQDDSPTPKYMVFLQVCWREGYNVLHTHYPDQPRTFRDLHRLLVLIRVEYRFTGAITLNPASKATKGNANDA